MIPVVFDPTGVCASRMSKVPIGSGASGGSRASGPPGAPTTSGLSVPRGGSGGGNERKSGSEGGIECIIDLGGEEVGREMIDVWMAVSRGAIGVSDCDASGSARVGAAGELSSVMLCVVGR